MYLNRYKIKADPQLMLAGRSLSAARLSLIFANALFLQTGRRAEEYIGNICLHDGLSCQSTATETQS
jgi:hypothetical protein